MHKNEMEERDFLLWLYFHQEASEQEIAIVQKKLKEDASWKAALDDIAKEESQLALLETEMPSLRFTRNVMDAIATSKQLPAVRSYMNTTKVRWILRAMVTVVVISLLCTIFLMPWKSMIHSAQPNEKIPEISINWSLLDNPYSLYGCVAVLLFCLLSFFSRIRESKESWSHHH